MVELTLLKYTTKEGNKKVRILKDASHKWKTIANLISSDTNKATTLAQQYTDPQDCLQELLVECFINKKPDKYQHNWNGMIELLSDVELESLAENVSEALGHPRTTT